MTFKGESPDAVDLRYSDSLPMTRRRASLCLLAMGGASTPFMVPANSPIRKMAELIAKANKDPASINYGSFGNGSPSPHTPQVKAGKLRALALNGTKRLPGLPDVPALCEDGVPFESVDWHAMFAPTGTWPEIIDKVNKDVNRIIAIPEVQTRLFEAGSFPVQPATTPQQWQEQFRKDVQSRGEMVRMSGATIQ